MRLSLALLVILCSSVALRAAEPDAAWDAAFTQSHGWTGGDGDYSIDLKDGRVLWTFADSFVGPVKEDGHPRKWMVNNALAVQPRKTGGVAPAAGEMTFFVGPVNDKGAPTAWVRPADEKQWYWLADGIVAPGPDGKDRLALFLWRMTRPEKPVAGAFNFKSAGGAIAIVGNPHEDAGKWHVEQFENPHAIGTDAAKASGGREIIWGSAVIAAPDGSGDLFIYGIREQPMDKQLLLARVPAGTIEKPETWRFKTASGWSAKLADAAPLADGMANELSVERIETDGVARCVMVHSEAMLGSHIMVRTAASPEGPWSKPRAVFNVEGVGKETGGFTYAAKSHPGLARPGELLISYIVSSNDFGKLVHDVSLYCPRFIRIPHRDF